MPRVTRSNSVRVMIAVRYLVLLLALLLAACDATTAVLPQDTAPEAVSIAYLKSLCREDIYLINRELSVSGQIVSSNRFGEFATRLVIQDPSGGLSLFVEDRHIARYYPYGTAVVLHCNGLCLRNYGGKIRLEQPATTVAEQKIPHDRLLRHLRPTPAQDRAPEPRRISLSELNPRLVDTYVRIDDLCFPERTTWCQYDSLAQRYVTTEHPALDARGDTIIVRTLGSVTYADVVLPREPVTLRGILDYFNHRYTLQIVNFGIYPQK